MAIKTVMRQATTMTLMLTVAIVGCSNSDRSESILEERTRPPLITPTTKPKADQLCETNAVPPICGLIPGQSASEVKALIGEPEYISEGNWYHYFAQGIQLSFKKDRLESVVYKPKTLSLGQVLQQLGPPDLIDLVVAGEHSSPGMAFNRSHLFWLERGVMIGISCVPPYRSDIAIGVVEYFRPMSEKELRAWRGGPRSFEKTIEWPGFED